MKFVAAYLLALLGAESAAAAAAAAAAAVAEGEEDGATLAAVVPARPTKEDVLRILASVGAEAEDEDHRLDMLFAQLEGKDVAELLAAGREQLAYAPSGAAAVVSRAAPAAAAAGEAKEEAKEEEKEDEGEDDGNMFSLFGDDE